MATFQDYFFNRGKDSASNGGVEEHQSSTPELLANSTSDVSMAQRLSTNWKLAVALAGLVFVIAVASIAGVCGAGKCTSTRGGVTSENTTSLSERNPRPTQAPSSYIPCPNATGPLRIGGRSIQLDGIETATATLPSCDSGGATRSARGAWYTIIGGGELVRASTCSSVSLEKSIGGGQVVQSASEEPSDTIIHVYDGSNCGKFECVAFNDQFCGSQSSVSWFAKKGHEYYLFVEGNRYELSIGFENNGECERSIGPVDTSGVMIAGSMRGRVELNYTYFTCGLEPTRGGQVWYWFKGTGKWMMASTCHPETDFAARLDVYGSRECILGTCVSPRDSDCGNGYQIVFKSEADTDYRAMVYKNTLIGGIQFGLSIKTLEPSPNDDCEGAMSLEPGTIVKGSTVTATFDFDFGSSSCENVKQPGVWYTVRGTGGPLIASTCNNETTYSSEISVFVGECGEASLECVSTTTQYCNEKASVYWQSVEDVTYYIFVHGSEFGVFPNVGEFELFVGPLVTEPNDPCTRAIPLQQNDKMVVGSNFNATFDYNQELCSPFFSEAPGVWYSIVGMGMNLRVSTCNPLTDFDTQITVYSGTCDSLACVNTDDSTCGLQSSVAWSATLGTAYYILVHGRLRSSVGRFALTVEEYEPLVSNDFCDAAIDSPVTGLKALGTTLGATFDNARFCVAPNTAPGVWYRVKGTGRDWVASMCNDDTDFNAALSVFEGDCVNLNCVHGNSDTGGSCGLKPQLTWMSKPNKDYFVLVHGYDTRQGSFSLELEEAHPTVESDYCVDAIPLEPSDSIILSSTNEATLDDTPSCSDLEQTHGGVWYSVKGTGKRLEASTCNSGEEEVTNFDTVLTIFSGECGELSCVLADDNFCGFQSKLVWLTEKDVTYYILVHGSEEGDFGLVVKEFVPSTVNDFCASAQGPILPNGDTYPGTTVGSSFDEAEECGSVSNTSPGVWFLVVGTGELLTVDTCSDKTNFDTKLSIYRGRSCANLECVAGNDDACGLQSSISWNSEIGVFYWILLHGWSTYGVGRFSLTVSGSDLFG